MHVTKINNINPYFTRKLSPEEQKDYRDNAIKPALDYLGTKELSMIMHGTCFPEDKSDIGVGSPYGKVAAQLIPFELLHGFSGIQLGPVGVIRSPLTISPYKSSVATRNYLFTDLHELSDKKYASILPSTVIENVFNHPKKSENNYSYSDFPEAFANYKYCMNIAYRNFVNKLQNNDPQALSLNEEFETFKQKNAKTVYMDALFDVLSKNYGTNDYSKWSDIDKNLVSGLENNDKDSIQRYKKVVRRSKNDFDSYVFGQFVIDKQIKENERIRKQLGFKYINDLLVGFSNSDAWAHQDLFLKDFKMGCPYGGTFGPQLWGIPVLDPQKLFKHDGSLGPAGAYLKEKLDKSLEHFDNIRIDHALGLVDPYIYDVNSVSSVNGHMDLSNFRANNISQWYEIDPKGDYRRIMNEIVLPTLKEHGLDKNTPVWEDLVTETDLFRQIYHNENNLPGITQLEWARGEDCPNKENVTLIGSHDSEPAMNMIKKHWVRENYAWNPLYLAGYLNSNPERYRERDAFCEKISKDDRARVNAKFAELFLTSKNIQISFSDFFGIDKVYNYAGSEQDSNWKLRLNKNYEDSYYKNLASDNPTALNMPEVLKIAVQGKSDMNQVKDNHNLGTPISHDNPVEVQRILDKLDKYEKILKE